MSNRNSVQVKSTYVLKSGEEGAKRLKILAGATWPTTQALLERVGLRSGMRCLDVGCGSGEVTLQIARVTGSKGEVVGVDADESILELAREEAERQHLKAKFRIADALQLKEEPNFELVYSRFLLTHLPHPQSAVDGMVRAVKPGGIIVLEDIDFSGHFCYPNCPAFYRYIELYQAVAIQRGSDPFIGTKLLGMLREANLEQVQMEVVLPTFNEGAGKLVAQVTMEHIRERVVTSDLATHEEIDAIIQDLDRFVSSPQTIISMPRVFQVWGRKK